MRRKRYLDNRINNAANYLLVRQGYDFYQLSPSERTNIVNLQQVFGNDNEVMLEIGCGKGAFACAMSQRYPDINFVAVEKLSNVIVEACEKAQILALNNLRFVNCAAENLLQFLPENSIKRIFLNFSCPFPKHTYANRRLTYKTYLNIYKRLLVDNGDILLKTDNKDFFDFSIQQFSDNGFELSEVTNDLHNSPYVVDNIVTEYEQKFLDKGMSINHLKATLKQLNYIH